MLLVSAAVLSSACFFYYGLSLLVSEHMAGEFTRYGLQRYRPFIGALQLAGSMGLALGVYLPKLAALASLGLATLMVLGIIARWKVNDSLWHMIPAILLGALNTFICVSLIVRISKQPQALLPL